MQRLVKTDGRYARSWVIVFQALIWLALAPTQITLAGVPVIPEPVSNGSLSGEAIWIYDSDLYVRHVEAADLNGDHVPDVIAGEYNSDYYGRPSRVLAIDGLTGDTLWSYLLDDGVRSMTIGDLNNDGVMDVVAGASYHSSDTPDGAVHAIDGKDGGQLWRFDIGATNEDVAVGNLNGDEYPDVAVASFDDYVYAINGQTGAQLWRRLIGSLWVNDVALADINGDDTDDVAYAHEYLTNYDNHFGVLDGTDGTFLWDSIATYVVLSVLVDDIDDDGQLEAVFGGATGSDSGVVFVRDASDGGLEWDYNIGSMNHTNGEVTLFSYDIDGDTDLDLLIGNNLATRHIIAFDGDNSTPMWVSDSLDGYPKDLAFGDIMGDGSLCVAAAAYDRVQVVHASNGAKVWYYAVDGTIASVATGDFDDDGVADVAAGGGAENTGTPPNPGKSVWALRTIESPLLWEYAFGEYGNALAIGNLNGDKYLDVAVVASVDDWAVAINGLTGTELWNWVGTENLFAVTTGDFDEDGHADVAVGGWDDIVTALHGDSGTVMWQFTTPTDDVYRKGLQAADLNSDGKIDVVAGSEDNYVYAINGLTGAQLWSTIAFPSDVEEIELAQMNAEGPVDVVAAIGGTSGKIVVINGSSGDVLWEYNINTAYTEHVEVLDANDDGIPDVAIATAKMGATPGRIIVVNGNTHSELWNVPTFLPTTNYALAHGDLNGDKAQDVVAGGNTDDRTVYAYSGLSGALLWSFPTGGEVNVVLVDEVTGDGQLDVLAGSDDQLLYVIDGGTGQSTFSYATAGDVMHIQTGDISGDGFPNIACVTFGSDGVAYAFKSMGQTQPDTLLVVSPDTLFFTTIDTGAGPSPDTFLVSEQGGASIAISLSESSTWFDIDKTSGTTPEEIQVSIDKTGLSPDTLLDSVMVSSAAAQNSPIYCVISLAVTSCCQNRGNADGIIGIGGPVDVADLVYLVAYLFQGGPPPPCEEEGNADGIVGAGGPVDVADVVYLVPYLFGGGPPPPPCP